MSRLGAVTACVIVAAGAAMACGSGGASSTKHHPSSVLTNPPPTPPAGASSVTRGITYCVNGGIALKMDLYYPQTRADSMPVVVYLHGGAWEFGTKLSEGGIVDFNPLLMHGYVIASVDYRLAPQFKFPAQIDDVKCSIRSLRAHADDYHIDPQRIGVWGASAGGHLAALLGVTDKSAGFDDAGGYTDESSAVQAVVDMFGPTDLLKPGFVPNTNAIAKAVFGVPAHAPSPVLKRASPVTYVGAGDAPFLVIHGAEDTVVPLSQSTEFVDRLHKAGDAAILVVVQNAGHGLAPTEQGPMKPTPTQVLTLITAFFDSDLHK